MVCLLLIALKYTSLAQQKKKKVLERQLTGFLNHKKNAYSVTLFLTKFL
jgi:hypothetical protein